MRLLANTLERALMKQIRIGIWLVVVALIALGAIRLHFDVEILNVLPAKLEAVNGLKLFQEHFTSGQELMVTVEADSVAAAETAAERLASVIGQQTNLVRTVMWRPPWQEHPDQGAELMAFLWFNQSPEVFSVVSNRLSDAGAQEAFRTVKEELATSLSPTEIGMRAYDPLSLMELPSSVTEASGMKASENFFSSADGKFHVVTVEPKTTLRNYRDCRAWFDSIKTVVHHAEDSADFHNVKVHFTGRPAFVAEISSGMQQDMVGTSGGTLLIIGLLFYLTHRRILPLIWLLILLVVMLAVTTALGGLVLGVVNVMSIGFASILVGLGEDFAIVLYQEAETHPERSISEIRREAAPGIIWSAITAAGAFASLNFSSLPGLAQLGTFVAIGLLVAAGVMLVAYLPPLARLKRKAPKPKSDGTPRFLLFETNRVTPPWIVWTVTGLIVCASVGFMLFGPPPFDRSPDPLRPKRSEAYETLALIKERLGHAEEPLWVIVRGRNEAEVSDGLAKLKQHLQQQSFATFTVADVLWPNPANQNANRATLRTIINRGAALETMAANEGFATNAMILTKRMFGTWSRAMEGTNVFWPAGDLSQWVLNKVAARDKHEQLALALVYPKSNTDVKPLLASWPRDFRENGILLSGWQLVGSAVFDLVLKELPRVTIPILALVILCLWLAFRDVREVVLSLVMLAFSAIALNAVMAVLGWKWNMLNLMAIPMLLGMGVDFSIHIQLALRKSNGDLLYVRRSVGKALLLAGATTVAGFGSLAFASNAGMASLGKTCALGIVLALITAVYCLPVWWDRLCRRVAN